MLALGLVGIALTLAPALVLTLGLLALALGLLG